MLSLPFEPRAPLFVAAGLRTTLPELMAGVSAAVLLWTGRARVLDLLRRPPLPLVLLSCLALTHVLSALVAPAHRALALKFSLRLLGAVLFATAVAVAPRRARGWALAGLAAASVVGATLAVGEGLGLVALDPWLDLFRERVFMAGAIRRATAGAAGPNPAAALLAAGLIAGVAVLGRRVHLALPFAVLLATGLILTYSRGGWIAAVLGLLVLAWARSDLRRGATFAAAVATALFAGFLAYPRFRERVQIELTARDYAVVYRPLDASVRMEPGERRALSADLVNSGREEWDPDDLVSMNVFTYEWPSRRPAGVARLNLPRAVPPGATERVTLEVQAPARAGTYVLAWDLFTLPTAYLSNSRIPPALVPLGVGVPPPADVVLPDHVWRRGRLELWRIAVAMWRDRPLLGVGPDNFRRLNAQYGGWLVPGFEPMTAHNLFLETAADTGTLGLACLLGTLVFAARSAWRGRARDLAAPAGLALLAALVVQGQVHALLEFTGCYLLFAFAVGAAAAAEREGAASDVPG